MIQEPSAGVRRGATGRIAYVAKMFPRLSETFVLNEILALRRMGTPLRIYSLLPATRDARVHSEAEAILHEVEVLPQLSWSALRYWLRDLMHCFRAAPMGTGIEVLRVLAWPRPRSLRRLFQSIALAARLRRGEVAHIHAAWSHTPAVVAASASRLTRIPWSMAAHAKDIFTARPEALAARLRTARFTLACSGAYADHLRGLAEAGVASEPPLIRLAYHGVDTAYFAPNGARPAHPPVLLTVGRLVPKKGIDTLIDAAGILQARNVPFEIEIAGDGPLRASLEERARAVGCEARIRWRGLLLREEVREAMRRATCFVLPCRITDGGDRDGIPNALAEAMASGLAVVSTNLPTIGELVEASVSGLLVDPDDPRALADALQRVLTDADLRARLGRNALVRVEERFDAASCETERAAFLSQARGIQRILYISADRGVPARGGKGASIHVRSMIEAWSGRNVETRLLTTNAGPESGAGVTGPVVESRSGRAGAKLAQALATITRPFATGRARAMERALLRLFDNVAIYRSGRAMVRAWRPDMIYERYSLCALAGGVLARCLGVPHVLEVNAPLVDEEARHRDLALGALSRALESWILRRADRVIVVSRELERHALACGVSGDRIRVLPNGVDPARFHPRREGRRIRSELSLDGTVVVGFAGSLKPWHGVRHLVRAFARARSAAPCLRLLIFGEGPERAALERLADECGVRNAVHFLGAVDHDGLGDHLAACDILAAPYTPSGGFYFSPLKVAEYRAMGRPVIATRFDGHSESEGVLSVEAGDEEGLERAILRLARDRELRGRLGRAAASNVWTWADVATATLRAADEVRPSLWGWTRGPLTVGYVLKMFPRFSETFVLREILELERAGVRVVVYSSKACTETIRQPGFERVRARYGGPPLESLALGAILGAQLDCIARHPIRYARTLAYVSRKGSRSAWTKFLQASFVARQARRGGVGHLHAHFASGPTRVAKFASMLSGIPFSFTAHAKDLYWSGHRHDETHKLRNRVRRASFVVAISERNRQFLAAIEARRPRIRTIHNGLDLAEWAFRPPAPSHGTNGNGPTVLSVGRLVEKKGFHVLVEAVARLDARGVRVRVWIAGDGPERQRIEEAIRRHRLGESITLLGAVTQDRLMTEFYPRATVLAQPSIVAPDGDQDGIPTVILEAMAAGLPVVATTVSGIPEAIRHEESGLLVDPEDPEALASALARILSDLGLRTRLSASARRALEERFDLEKNAAELIRLFAHSALRQTVTEEAP